MQCAVCTKKRGRFACTKCISHIVERISAVSTRKSTAQTLQLRGTGIVSSQLVQAVNKRIELLNKDISEQKSKIERGSFPCVVNGRLTTFRSIIPRRSCCQSRKEAKRYRVYERFIQDTTE